VSKYHLSVAQDGMYVLSQRFIQTKCFTKEILSVIMGDAYSPANHCIIAYNNITQEMFAKKIRSNNKLILRVLQVGRLKWECMGTPLSIKRNYLIDYVVVDANGRRNLQQNTIIIVKLKKAQERTAAVEVKVGKITIIGTFTFSQGSSNHSPPPATQEEALQAKRT
jgi:hypothetical protein